MVTWKNQEEEAKAEPNTAPTRTLVVQGIKEGGPEDEECQVPTEVSCPRAGWQLMGNNTKSETGQEPGFPSGSSPQAWQTLRV